MLEQQLEQDTKTALLSGDSHKVSTLRGLKAALLNVKIASGKRDSGLSDDEVIQVLAKESKKRQESADLYKSGGDEARAEKELTEKTMIDSYLPAQLGADELNQLIDQVIAELGVSGPANMGQVIGQVKQRAGATADGAIIAGLVKEKLK